MSSKYKFYDNEAIHFVTNTVVGWADVFTTDVYRIILLDSFWFCQQKKGFNIRCRVLITNHFQMICSVSDGHEAWMVLKNIKNFTAIKIINAIINNKQECR